MFHPTFSRYTLITFIFLLLFSKTPLSSEYQLPTKPLQDVVEQTKKVSTRLSNDGQWLAVLTPRTHQSIQTLAKAERKLAGLRLSPKQLIPSRIKSRYLSIELISVNSTNLSAKPEEITLPQNLELTNVQFSPNSRFLSFIGLSESGADLYLYEIATKLTTRLNPTRLNASLGLSYHWLNSSMGVVTNLVIVGDHVDVQTESISPNISETLGKKAPRRTYQDLLKNAQDEAEFSALTTSQLSIIFLDGNLTNIGQPAINSSYSLSPDDRYLLVKRISAPFSHMVKYYDFAQTIEVFHTSGSKLSTLAHLESGEYRPPGSDSVKKGPRMVHWRSDKPSTLAYVKALDKGDSRTEVSHRDQLLQLDAPFNLAAKMLVKTPWRISKISWGEQNKALITERNSDKKQIRVSFLDTQTQVGDPLSLWYQKASRDTYKDPGKLYRKPLTQDGHLLGRVFHLEDNTLVHYGLGASPEGYQPFLKSLTLPQGDNKTDKQSAHTLWRSSQKQLETVRYVVNLKPLTLVINRQSNDSPSHLVLLNVESGKEKILYQKQGPLSAFKGMSRQLITYKRNDGLPLSGILYLPSGYNKEEGPLPVLMWAYPREYKNAEVASQVNYSVNQYTQISAKGPIPFIANGFAIFDRVAMPIIGEGKDKPNDSFRTQLINNATAAIDTLVDMGIADRERIAIGGHSYGAFMVANLLAHSDLFAAGIARSGAYNRTLTPFGFQHEKRNFWEAPSLYQQISPFTHADKIDEPLLLMHGEMDANSGTYPMQSARLYKAIRGLGGQARLVTFPFESHSYKAKESILHMLWEQENWLKLHLKQPKLTHGNNT
ncbi:prolyl oligopeptidase family serine peptidase [Shewanella sp. D64]|uniref:alpha/beta hydrolase family protein n=1 Tax=unclassified Shewanella TaxID=196818 RepID=UPI0022BA2BED|nr:MULTISPECIES: prolyl oligopeptidase family serine peptidase [unclassified Shewanella]MEC4726691.1 prolyl oligopeptidase family serine peptidase [Shewanella sp. D64]MEC4738945.1 prolyl oligopeptidase family serine peptidase [Shewanella sp. E94]WBJ96904.1 prolyl oligopeptidase family serine peptidase [Shewanella sp. MTB7]